MFFLGLDLIIKLKSHSKEHHHDGNPLYIFDGMMEGENA